KAKLNRVQESGIAKNGTKSLKIIFEPDDGVAKSGAVLSRPFLYPQDWSKYGKLDLWVRCENSTALKIGIKDKEAEPFETRPVYLDKGDWDKVSFDLRDGLVRGPLLPGYGNSKFDREEVREISLEISPRDNTAKTVIYIDEITLE
ncbi:MAG: hypothetical protein PHR22_01045, partial [Candidatus Omnitrophica bacterium]|nr:hypothetical protein [Candidatus Omnitrophota bacterium]